VNFATRSFIDEFYNVFLNNADFKVEVELINVSADIQSMFDAVKSTQRNKIPITLKNSSDTIIKLSSISEINNYLSTLSFL